MSAAGKTGSFGPSIQNGPAPAQPQQAPKQDIYSRLGGLPNVDSDPFTEGYQPPTPGMQKPQNPGFQAGVHGQPGMFGKSGFGLAHNQNHNPNERSPLGPEGQQPVVTQPPAFDPTQATRQNPSVSIGFNQAQPMFFGGKGGFGPAVMPAQPINQQQTDEFGNAIIGDGQQNAY